MQRLITSLKVINTKCDNILSVCLLCMSGLSLIISDQEDENIWIILAMEIDCQILALKHRVLLHNSF